MENIENMDIYNKRMANGMEDKLFFLNYLDPSITTILDYGCADGSLGKAINELRPDLKYVGFDENKEMISLARVNYSKGFYYNYFIDTLSVIKPNKTILILSSVLHEIYSYKTNNDIQYIWNEIFAPSFKQISIRDMGLRNNDSINLPVPIAAANAVTTYIMEHYHKAVEINNFADYYQLYLKYWYSDNWERESKENYFALSVEDLLNKLKEEGNYQSAYSYGYTLPYLKNKVVTDFGFNPFTKNTHYKIVLNRKEEEE